MPLRIVTWNVNSIRARQPRVVDWLARHRPDVALLQETKCTDAQFAGGGFTDAYEALGYEVAHHGHDHWNGVAILSRVGLADVRRGFPGTNRPPYDEARVISARCGDMRAWSLYAPNGRTLSDPHYLFKLVWFERLRAAVAAEPGDAPHVVAGDFNVAPSDRDIYDPVRWRRLTHASPPERAAVQALVDLGLRDVTREHVPEAGVYTWWSYRPGQVDRNRGLRIDLALCSPAVADGVRNVWIDRDERMGILASDHAPVVVDEPSERRPLRGGEEVLERYVHECNPRFGEQLVGVPELSADVHASALLLLDERTAEDNGFAVGDTVAMITSGEQPRLEAELVGTVAFGGGGLAGANSVTATATDTAVPPTATATDTAVPPTATVSMLKLRYVWLPLMTSSSSGTQKELGKPP